MKGVHFEKKAFLIVCRAWDTISHMDVKLELLYLKRAYENMETLHEESSLFSPAEFKKIEQELGKEYKKNYKRFSDDYLYVIQHKIDHDMYIADDITENYMTHDGDYLPSSVMNCGMKMMFVFYCQLEQPKR